MFSSILRGTSVSPTSASRRKALRGTSVRDQSVEHPSTSPQKSSSKWGMVRLLIGGHSAPYCMNCLPVSLRSTAQLETSSSSKSSSGSRKFLLGSLMTAKTFLRASSKRTQTPASALLGPMRSSATPGSRAWIGLSFTTRSSRCRLSR